MLSEGNQDSAKPTVLSLVFMTIAVHEVGATPTAIMGALEPLTAVALLGSALA